MSKNKDANLVQDALIPDEMSPLSLLDFNAPCAKIKQAAVDFRRAVNHKMQLADKASYLDKFHQIDPYTEAVYDTDMLAQHIIDCAEAMNRLLTYPKEARKAVMLGDLHKSLKPFEESAHETTISVTLGGHKDDTEQPSVDPMTGEITEE